MEEKITHLLEQLFSTTEFSNCFTVEIKLHAHNKLDVFIDCDEGVTLETCQKVSRYLEQHLDKEGWLGEKYILEVSSPGASRPLLLARQYPKHIGRKLEVTLHDGTEHVGTLTAANDKVISLLVKERIQQGKRKKRVETTHEVAYDQIKKAQVKITF